MAHAAHGTPAPAWLSVEQALERILALVPVLEPEERPILQALGQTLAEDVVAGVTIPPLDNAAMDGYAARAADLAGAAADSPVTLRVIGEVAAGYVSSQAVAPGTALRIMTGAPVPAGADTVVPFEWTDELDQKQAGRPAGPIAQVAIRRASELGQNIRRAGEDLAQGEPVLPRGRVIRPAEVGVLATLGRASVRVIRRPRVAILATGDELAQPGEPLRPGQIYDANSYGLAAQVLRYGGHPELLGVARDTIEALTERLRTGLEADLLVTSAGVSLGDYDIVKDVLAREGEVRFWTVRMKPGKPLAFGRLRGAGGRWLPHLGLPGNPVSAMLAFELFGRPALAKLLGQPMPRPVMITARLAEAVTNTDGRRCYYRAVVRREGHEYAARLTGPQGSGILTSMARANALIVVPEDVARIEAGEMAQVQMLDWMMSVDGEGD